MSIVSAWPRFILALVLATAVVSPSQGGILEGRVTDAETAEPVRGASLELHLSDFILVTSTDLDGNYSFEGLSTNDYILVTRGAGYIPETYDDIVCHPLQGCPTGSEVTRIPVTAGSTTSGIDVELRRGAMINGRVTDAATGEPLSIALAIHDPESGFLSQPFSSEDGTFSSGMIPAGTYYVRTENQDYLNEIYDGVRCPFQASCEWEDGTPIQLGWGDTANGIDIALDKFATVSGTITDRATGEPIAVAFIRLLRDTGDQFFNGYSQQDGTYLIDGVRPGNYTVEVSHPRYQGELYDDIPCEDCDPSEGMLIAADLNTASNIDFALERRGSISGIVTRRTTGEPIEGATVKIWDETGDSVGFGISGEDGTYMSQNFPSGIYYATVEDMYHLGELYEDLPCEGCDATTGTPIPVELNTDSGGIDFALEHFGEISGRVTHSTTGQPLRFVTVEVYNTEGVLVGTDRTDEAGDYLVQGLEPGKHFAVATGSLVIDELYDDLPCEGGCDPTAGMPIATSLNTVTRGIDFALDQLGSIGGRVLHDGQLVTDARIAIYDAAGAFRIASFTNVEGTYSVRGLPTGIYYAVAEHDLFDDELYDNLPCEGGCDPTTGTPIVVNHNVNQEVDFDLGFCTPTATSLCLAGDRFRVEALWEDFDHEMGPASAGGLTPDAGTFWFFDPNNVEMVVKILDVCDRPEHRFWVFAAGLTNVGVELKVTDELTGESVSYGNPLGTTYETVLDTQAFDTCDAGVQGLEPDPKATRRTDLPAVVLPPAALLGKGDCVPSATTLCLNAGRFMVEAEWLTDEGVGGPARAEPLTDETGYFWFGSADNVEVMVKVLDACGLPSFENYWVFGAGLTNFEITLRVTDTETGEVQEYFNPQSRTFETVTDLGHFMTCP